MDKRKKITDKQARLIKRLMEIGEDPVDLAKAFQVSRQTIYNIARGRRKALRPVPAPDWLLGDVK